MPGATRSADGEVVTSSAPRSAPNLSAELGAPGPDCTVARRRTALLAAGVIVAVAMFYQWPRLSFVNDHFEILSKAQRVVDGELPYRDFFDNGRPLAIALTAIGLKLSNGSLIGEALLTMGAIAVGVALLFLLSLELTGSWVLAGWAALCLLTIDPRLYNYGKVLIAIGGMALAFRYVDRPDLRRAAAFGAGVGLAFLWRHDFGIYLSVLAVALFLPGLWSRPRDTVRHAAAAAGVAAAVVLPYAIYLWTLNALTATATGGAGTLLDAASLTWRPFTWGERGGGMLWSRQDGETWVYDAFIAAPIAAAYLLIRRRPASAIAHKAGMLAAFCVSLVLFLIRGNLDSRLPDAAGPSFLLLAWLFSTARSAGSRVVAGALALVTLLAVEAMGGQNPVRRLAREVLDLPQSVSVAWAAMRGDPAVWWETDGLTDTRALARWLRECTAPTDRVLVFGYYPDVVFFSRRAFAGGQVFLHSGYFSSPDEQTLTVARLQRQSVPFVIVERAELPALRGTYAGIGAFVLAHYTAVATSDFHGPHAFTIFQRNDVTLRLRTDGLPCARTSG